METNLAKRDRAYRAGRNRAGQPDKKLAGPISSFFLHAGLIYLLTVYVIVEPEKYGPEVDVFVSEEEVADLQERQSEPWEERNDAELDETPVMEPEPPTLTEIMDVPIENINEEIPSVEIGFNIDTLLQLENVRNPLKLSPLYDGRTVNQRQQLVRKHGGSKSGQATVLNALRWLKSVQSDNGSWSEKPAHTALALLCFLAHGETPDSEEFGLSIQKAMRFLVRTMPPEGKLGGKPTYQNGIVTYALCEAYGMSRNPLLRSTMESGLKLIVDGQQASGGFDYKYAKGKRWDLSIAGWQIQAMKSGYVAGANTSGLYDAMKKALRFVKSTFIKENFQYSPAGPGVNMAGVGTLCLQLLGEPGSREAKNGCETIATIRLPAMKALLKNSADWSETAAKYLYGWYYDTQAMFHKSGRHWQNWNQSFQQVLIENQSSEGYWDVGKAAYGFTDDLAGKVYCTALCCLQLEVYYRYLPTYKMPKEHLIREAKRNITDEDDAALVIE